MLDFGNAPRYTGTGVYSTGLMDALRTYESETISLEEAGISWAGTSFRPARRILYLWRLKRLAAKGFRGAQLVHFTNVYVPPKRANVSFVVTIHDLDAIQHPEVYSGRYSMYYDAAVKKAVERAHRVIAVTETVRRSIVERYDLPEDKVIAAGNGLNPLFVEAAQRNIPLLREELPVLLFVGRLEKKKNVAWLIETVTQGVNSRILPKCKLILAGGKGFGFHEIAKQIRDSGEIARWEESPSIEALAALYKRSSVVVLPSICEGFGIPLIEAMHCRKSIVSSNIPTSREVAGDIAHFFSLGNREDFYRAVLSALEINATEEREAAVRRQLSKYDWQRLASIHAGVYKNTCRS